MTPILDSEQLRPGSDSLDNCDGSRCSSGLWVLTAMIAEEAETSHSLIRGSDDSCSKVRYKSTISSSVVSLSSSSEKESSQASSSSSLPWYSSTIDCAIASSCAISEGGSLTGLVAMVLDLILDASRDFPLSVKGMGEFAIDI